MQVCQVSASILLMVSEKNFDIFFGKFTLYVAPSTNQIKRFGQKSHETWRITQ